MNYELAKKLKDEGFPQKTNCECCSQVIGEDDEFVILPTLSELIEACHGEIMLLRDINVTSVEYKAGIATSGIICKGSTPEIAVANLWLELNKK
jgi:hypothetical protein